MTLDVQALREQFPILSRQVHGKPLVYLDNAASTQKPQCMLDALIHYYQHQHSNVHRGAHALADEATIAFEASRDLLQRYLGASDRREVIFTKGTTEAINLVASGLGQELQTGDWVVITALEHHANLVPWQQLCLARGAQLRVVALTESGEVDADDYGRALALAPKIVSFAHVSNALGTINPIASMATAAKAVGAWVMVDGAQGAAHGPLELSGTDIDFYALSAHKLYGPTGLGVLWGRFASLDALPPYQLGGEMIKSVSFASTEFNELPYRLEAGTPNIADVVAFGAVIQWLLTLDWPALQTHEQALLTYATEQLTALGGFTIHGQARHKISVLSFNLAGCHPSDLGFLLDQQGIAIRTGSHCAEPLMQSLSLPGTARASFAIYNTLAEVDALIAALAKAKSMLVE